MLSDDACHIADINARMMNNVQKRGQEDSVKVLHLSSVAAALTAFMASTSINAEDFVAEAPISAVKIHRNYGAIVTRSFTMDLPAGDHTITVPGLTDRLEKGYALRANIVSGNAIISQVQLDQIFLANEGRDAQAALLSQLENLETAQAKDRTSIEAINMQLSFIQGMAKDAAASGDYSSPADMMEALQQTFDFVKSNSGNLLTERQSLEAAMKDRMEEIKALKREIDQTGGTSESAMEATLIVSAPSNGPVEIAVNYLVEDATWDIDAEANLNSLTNETELKLYARLSQETKEDWKNVTVSVSTTRPSNNIKVGQPYPIYLNLRDPRNDRVRKLESVSTPRFSDAEPIEEVIVTGTRRSNYVSSQFDAEFQIAGPITLEADGSEQRFLLQDQSTKSETVIRIVPQTERKAFVYADAEFQGIPFIEYPEISISRDNGFVGSGSWPTLRPDKELQLPFGSDPKIDVEVITIPSEDGDEGIFSRKRVDETKKQFRVTNNHEVAMTIEVFDARPNSMNEDLEIELLRGTTRTAEVDYKDQPGIVMWRKTVAPGETWEINHWYKVSFPEDMAVVQQ